MTTHSYPDSFEIEFDRLALRSYYRQISVFVLFLLFSFIGVVALSNGIAEQLKNIDAKTFSDIISVIAKWVGYCLLSILVAIGIIYILVIHSYSEKLASRIKLSVEGAFLRIQKTNSDRKIHFRSIVDYSTIDGWLLRRNGILILQMTLIGGGQYPFLQFPGVKDALKVRDMLAEIDSQRENG